MEINILLSNNMNFYNIVNSIKSSFLPKLVSSLNTKTNSAYQKMVVSALKEINNMLDGKSVKTLGSSLESIVSGFKTKLQKGNEAVKRFLSDKHTSEDEEGAPELDDMVKFVKEKYYTFEEVEKLLKTSLDDNPVSDEYVQISTDSIKHNADTIVSMFDDDKKLQKK